ncbi:MAG: deoxyribodipyrimidine photo-lyase [Gammaproteobacteria bacterium]|nr:deoxyribodipyrimidine photo-lyase [Gammaproteobacteria bacterium]MDD9897296.1 deoxyribodipyrimidine photo-lyase [Gammaproteobacteria bacterium]MDD9959458.1 deoxyribodipyrimidine photo-lyase [Gammaproteobacteria bacterium]
MNPVTLMWFRQDLRLQDNPALTAAISDGHVLPIYILDDTNAGAWQLGAASRWWLHHSLQQLDKTLDHKLWLFQGDPQRIIRQLISEHGIGTVYWNRCYEPWRINRDKGIKAELEKAGVAVHSFNASLLSEPWMNLKQDDTPYKVFTPFYKKCIQQLSDIDPLKLDSDTLTLIPCQQKQGKIESLNLLPKIAWYKQMEKIWSPGEAGAHERLIRFIQSGIENYKTGRDFPSLNAVSRISPHLHFGEISPRQILANVAQATHGHQIEGQVEHYHRELAWREFSYSLLYHYPEITTQNMNRNFDRFPWMNNAKLLSIWQQGKTGYPIIDAGMRELWNTGYMHNRVRMIVASFLVKNLGIPWQRGAEWFWDCLLDADLANNSCSWQWVAGCGTDAAPYFRIFNPVTQSQKFDAKGEYIRAYVPELRNCPDKLIHDPGSADETELAKHGIRLGRDYPRPVVDLKESREAALNAYKSLKE